MRFVTFQDAEDGAFVKVRADAVVAVAGRFGGNGRSSDVCHLLLSGESGMMVRGTVEEVSAALEAAGAPAVAPVVEVAPTDLERAAGVLDALVRVAAHANRVPDWHDIDQALGLEPEDTDWSGTTDAMRALAARLRGAQ